MRDNWWDRFLLLLSNIIGYCNYWFSFNYRLPSEAAVTWIIMKPELSPPLGVRKVGRPERSWEGQSSILISECFFFEIVAIRRRKVSWIDQKIRWYLVDESFQPSLWHLCELVHSNCKVVECLRKSIIVLGPEPEKLGYSRLVFCSYRLSL